LVHALRQLPLGGKRKTGKNSAGGEVPVRRICPRAAGSARACTAKNNNVGGTMKHIAVDHFSRYLFPSSLKARGDLVAFIGKRASVEDNKYYSDIYLFDGTAVRRLTSSGEVQSLYWLGDSLIFPDIRREKDKERIEKKLPLTILQRLDPGFGEAQEFARFSMPITDMVFISEDETSSPPPTTR